MDRIKSAINKIWSYELSHMFVYSVIINIVMECLNKRGVTGLYGKGMYKSKDKLVLICAASRNDTAKIKDLAKKIDEKCFIVITNAREVLGKGFKEV